MGMVFSVAFYSQIDRAARRLLRREDAAKLEMEKAALASGRVDKSLLARSHKSVEEGDSSDDLVEMGEGGTMFSSEES